MAELNRPANFNGLDDDFGDMPTPDETRQQADKAFRNASDTREQSADPETQELEESQIEPLRAAKFSPETEEQYRRLTQARYGMTPEEMELRVAQAIDAEQNAREGAEAHAWMAHRSEYLPTPHNSEKLMQFIEQSGLPLTAQSLDYAFDVLTKQGALETANTRPRPTPTLSDREGVRPDYVNSERPQFDTDGFRTLSSGARRQYVAAVEQAERAGTRIPTVAEFKRQYRASPVD